MFTQKLTAWREKQRPETAWFQGKIQVEKSGGNLGHIYRVTPQQHLSPLAASSDEGGHFHCNHNVFTRFGRTQRTAPPLREHSGEQGGEPRGARWGAGWGAGWGTPGSKVGSSVGSRAGNPGEQGGEQCGGTPSGSHNTTEQGISGGPNGTSQPVFATITCDISKWGAPVSRRAPLRQLCAYDVSRCPCDYPSVVPDPG